MNAWPLRLRLDPGGSPLAARLLMTLPLCLASCRIQRDIEGTDRDAFGASFRAFWEVHPRAGGSGLEDEEGASRGAGKGHLGVELDVGYVAGDDDQGLAGNEFVQLGGTQFLGPATVDLDWTLLAGSIALRGGARVEDVLVVEGIGGLGLTRLHLEAEDGALSASETFSSVGPILGLQAGVEPLPWLGAFVRSTWTGGFVPDEASLGVTDLALTLKPAKRVVAFGGWRWWDYGAEGNSGDSDVELKLSGPMLGIELRF